MTEEFGLISAFLVGLLGGVHCLGMCGGLVSALSLSLDNDLASSKQWPLHLAYNFGRIFSYSLAGVLVGALGLLPASQLPVYQAQAALLLMAGIFMILLGLYLAGWWRVLRYVEQAGGHLWKRLQPLGRGLLPVRNAKQALLLGLLWGWLPCGLVYSALIWALSSGSALQGGLLMLAFGLGTLPNLLLIGAFAGWIRPKLQSAAVRGLAGSLVIGLGVWNLYLAVGALGR